MARTLTARLVVLPPHTGGQNQVPLDRPRLLIGRDPRSDLVLNEPNVSWHNAEVSRSDGCWTVRDLGSTNGTTLHDRPVRASVEIRDGDVLTLGYVQVRLEDPRRSPRAGGPATAVLPPIGSPASRNREPDVRFSVGDQWTGGSINNVEGMQNNYVLHQRESFLREVAATRTKASWFVWLGLALFVGGLGTTFYAAKQAADSMGSVLGADPTSFVEGFQGSMSLALLGEAAVVGGVILIIIGIVLHVVATARRRRLDERFPTPRQWPPMH